MAKYWQNVTGTHNYTLPLDLFLYIVWTHFSYFYMYTFLFKLCIYTCTLIIKGWFGSTYLFSNHVGWQLILGDCALSICYFCNGYNILHVPPKRGHRGATLSKFIFLYLGWFHCLYDTGTRNTGLQESWVPGILGCLDYFSTAILGFWNTSIY